jgi:energy-coupling factor transport system substrate-specific component
MIRVSSPRILALIPVAVALNLATGLVVAELSLPVYLDTIGTVLAAALAGPAAGVVTGLVSQLLTSMFAGYMWLAFAPIQLLIALLAGLAAARGGFHAPVVAAGWGAFVGLLAGAASSVISYFAFGGVTAGGVTAVTTILRSTGLSLPQSVVLASIGTDLVDKALVFLAVAIVLAGLPRRIIGRYPWAVRAVSP